MMFNGLYLFDRNMRKKHGRLLCGVDEAGRGPLAGPVVCAAVVLASDSAFDNLRDSKAMTKTQRSKVFEQLMEVAVCCSVIFIDNKEIDILNILGATMKGMRSALETLEITPDYVIIDGNKAPDTHLKTETIIKGDSKSASIAAASVIAKVSRDRYMDEVDVIYPEFKFSQHKGYPTKLHYEMIEKYGVTDLHRKSFLKGIA